MRSLVLGVIFFYAFCISYNYSTVFNFNFFKFFNLFLTAVNFFHFWFFEINVGGVFGSICAIFSSISSS